MEHSPKFDMINQYYHTFYNGSRLWSAEKVGHAVLREWITSEEYEEIVGTPYTPQGNIPLSVGDVAQMLSALT